MKTSLNPTAIRWLLASLLISALPLAHAETFVPAWTGLYNGPGNAWDEAHVIAVDHSNNVTVAGMSYGGSSMDYATIHYSNSGLPLWTNRYNGPGNATDSVSAMVVDASNNVIITGYSAGSGTTNDYATIKYSSAGAPLWTNRYNGPVNGRDSATAVAVDSSNNVFVTGYSIGAGTASDFATIKYSSEGIPLWTNRYNGPANGNDQANAIAVGVNNNVIVTGFSDGGATGEDFLTIAYSNEGVPLWTNRDTGQLWSTADRAFAVAVDGNNNVTVTGFSTKPSGNLKDYLTIQYSPEGALLWTRRYSGPVNGDNAAYALAVDSSNNVVVAGYSASSSSSPYNYDYAVIKYSSAGASLWTNRYNGTGNSDDTAYAVAIDGSNSVVVTGSASASATPPYNYNYATLKYSTAGVALWTNLYNGAANSQDSSYAVAIDGSNNVFVTGASYATASSPDFLTIMYSLPQAPAITAQPVSLTNNQATTAMFGIVVSGTAPLTYRWLKGTSPLVNGGRVSGATTSTLTLSNVTTNEAGTYSVVITNLAGSVTSAPALLAVRVPPAIVSQPTDQTINPGTIAVFSVAATGTAPLSYQWLQGVTVLVDGGNVSGASTDTLTLSNATASDAGSYSVLVSNLAATVTSSNALLTVRDPPAISSQPVCRTNTAWTTAIFTVTASGTDPLSYQWQKGTTLLTDGGSVSGAATPTLILGGVTATDAGSYSVTITNLAGIVASSNAVLTVLQPTGNVVEAWSQRHNPSGIYGYETRAYAMAVDHSDSVIVAGSSWDFYTYHNFETIKYSSAGVRLWRNSLSWGGDDDAYAVAVDTSNNVIVTGYSDGGSTGYDYLTIKYSSAGVPLWTNRYSETQYANDDVAVAVAVDSNNCVLVTGRAVVGNQTYGFLTIKYSSDGAVLWINRHAPGCATAMAIDTDNSVIVTGYVERGDNYPYSNQDCMTIKYSSTGIPLWTNLYAGLIKGEDVGRAVYVDGSNNVIVSGYSYVDGISSHYLTIQYSSEGTPLWTNRYNNGHGNDYATALAVDSDGNIVVTGYSAGAGPYWDYATIKYSSAGVALWTNRYSGPANGDDRACALAIDRSNNVVVTGSSAANDSSPFSYDYATIQYSSAGVPLWTNRYDGPVEGDDTPCAVAVDSSNSVIVAGTSGPQWFNTDFFTIKYVPVLSSPTPIAPRFDTSPTGLAWTTNGLRLTVVGLQGTGPVTISVSTNLLDWLPLLTNPPATGVLQVIDDQATNWNKRFYRVSE